ncbi:hypothetical protein DPMN_181203 [Dreissena polymorpha]|uniref:Uncharacterized protein n=1 Tax=Dreissena polymorpha TaxID=45954 RepID=A0A9D4I528_DREPO|nr:hypothetical protein DPMN_181203 [Dreissena polymorpha]
MPTGAVAHKACARIDQYNDAPPLGSFSWIKRYILLTQGRKSAFKSSGKVNIAAKIH